MLMTIDEIALYLKVSRGTIYGLIKKRMIPATKIGGQWRFKREVIDNWLDGKNKSNLDSSELQNLK